ncbi:MAG TPA: metallophosphoesterase family protein [Deinococcales bacterium]|nr:metallophosphoesterase family protein [Deinococcales bacterium]
MRLGVLSDVHGNRFALQAVLEDLRRAAPDAILNLGDQAYGAADPLAATELQAALGAVEVRGNNDERVDPRYDPVFDDAPREPFTAWVREAIGPAHAARLGALPLTATLAGGTVLAFHASPRNAWTAALETWEDGRMERLATEAEVRERLAGFGPPALVITGHTHRERELRFDGFTVVNAGSVGWQHDGDPRARWTLLTRGHDGEWRAEFRRVPYDTRAAAAHVQRVSPEPEPEVSMIARATRLGRWPARTPTPPA